MAVHIIDKKIGRALLEKYAKEDYGDMIKGVVDLTRGIIALGGELHADAEEILLEDGSKQEDLWGFNIHLDKSGEERIEYTSFINIRPRHNNHSNLIKDE